MQDYVNQEFRTYVAVWFEGFLRVYTYHKVAMKFNAAFQVLQLNELNPTVWVFSGWTHYACSLQNFPELRLLIEKNTTDSNAMLSPYEMFTNSTDSWYISGHVTEIIRMSIAKMLFQK